eukprot:UC4_evm3s67
MLKLFSIKQENDQAQSSGVARTSAPKLRAQKDHNELKLPDTCKITFPDPDDVMNFNMELCPDEGLYKGGRFHFTFKIPGDYPYKPPEVHCDTKVYHPNLDLQGHVCLNILRAEWKPVLTIQAVVFGLQFLFLEPNAEDPLNKEAAEEMKSNRQRFEQNVYKSMRGGYVNGESFPRCLAWFSQRDTTK